MLGVQFCVFTCSKKLNCHGMSCSLVIVKVLSPLSLKITVITLQNSVTVLCCNVSLKTALCRS